MSPNMCYLSLRSAHRRKRRSLSSMRCSWPRPRRPCSINWRATTSSPRRSSRGAARGAIPPGYVGMAAPAHAVAAGRVLLAALPVTQLDSILNRSTADPESDFPLTDRDALRTELERIRHAGYALDHGTGYPTSAASRPRCSTPLAEWTTAYG